jgi:hypothetical protein
MGNRVDELRSHTSNNISFAKCLSKRGGPRASPAIHDLLGLTFYSIDEVNIIADCLENQFRAHDLCDCDHRRHVEAQV